MITRPSFGAIHAAEAMRLANGALSYGHKVSLILVNDGILVAKNGQNAEDSGWTSLSSLVEDFSKSSNARVLADIEKAKELGMTEKDVAAGVRLVDLGTITSEVVDSDRLAVF